LHLYERFIKLVGEPEAGKSSGTRTRGLPWLLRIVDVVSDSYAAAEAAWEKQVVRAYDAGLLFNCCCLAFLPWDAHSLHILCSTA
jgi:hypothetical protein